MYTTLSGSCRRQNALLRDTVITSNKMIETTWILNDYVSVTKTLEWCKEKCMTAIKGQLPNHIKVFGTNDQYTNVLRVHLSQSSEGHVVLNNDISVPKELCISHIIGLDTTPIAKPRYIIRDNKGITPRTHTTFDSSQLATIYGFPVGTGSGQKVGIIELGGGYSPSDIQTYLNMIGMSSMIPNLVAVSVDGATNDISDTSGASVEVLLDIEVIIAIVPLAEIRIYFGPNSDQGFYNAIAQAYIDGCGAISISWGAAERYWSSSVMQAYNTLFQIIAAAGVTVTAAAGDDGSSDGAPGINTDFPCTSPYVLACGGTSLVANAGKTAAVSEVVWNSSGGSTGGGISSLFAKPSYQSALTLAKRGVPDIAANADPNTGYIVYGEGQTMIVGGTSAVSPLWAALATRINQLRGSFSGPFHSVLYTNPTVSKDITSGNNGAYTAGNGWDACTGWGCPKGTILLSVLNGGPAPNTGPQTPIANFTAAIIRTKKNTIQYTDKSTNTPTSWLWEFGNSSISRLKNPSYTYTRKGAYTVALTTSNATGSNRVTKKIFV